jgi:exodeoxyribonuclease V alpha subunit
MRRRGIQDGPTTEREPAPPEGKGVPPEPDRVAEQAGNPPRPPQGPVTLEATIERVCYAVEGTGWTVAKARAGRRMLTIVGTLPPVKPGEPWRVEGAWTRHPRYGEQLQVERAEPVIPTGERGLEAYLAAAIDGVGPILARRLIQRFGSALREVLDRAPEQLHEVAGLTDDRIGRIIQSWRAQTSVREILVFLHAHGTTPALAAKILRQYGELTLPRLQSNPYRLAEDIPGVGFLAADRLALNLAIPHDSPLRAGAGFLHVLREAAANGHVFLPRVELLSKALDLLGVDGDRLGEALDSLANTGGVVRSRDVGDIEDIYLPSLYEAEIEAAQHLIRLLRATRGDRRRPAPSIAAAAGLDLSVEQREAIRLGLKEKILVVTGGPGTGKTTIIQILTRLLEQQRFRVVLASPTGRAAKRLAEVTGRPASTIHRLLGFAGGIGFTRTVENPLEPDVVVIDEMSMVDTWLFAALVQAVPSYATLILIGDADQLPSVGPGTILTDLFSIPEIPAIRLNVVYRQAAESRIVTSAHRVLRGLLPPLDPPAHGSDFGFIAEPDVQQLQHLVVRLAAAEIPQQCHVDPFTEVQVITPMHCGPVGTVALNEALQAALNPPSPTKRELQHGGATFRDGDRVMCIHNLYDDRQLMNGDVGRITAVEPEEGRLSVLFDDRLVVLDRIDLENLVLSYACSVHKAQESEHRVCLVVMSLDHHILLVRDLLYTAITRGKELVLLVGSPQAVGVAVRTENTSRRYAALPRRFELACAGQPTTEAEAPLPPLADHPVQPVEKN